MLLLASYWWKNFLQYFGLLILLIASTSYSRTLVNCSQFVLLLSMLLVSQSTFIIIVIQCIWWGSSLEGEKKLRPAPTRFATNFIALQSILAHKDELRAMVTSREWVTSNYAKHNKGKKFVESVLDFLFWEECAIIVWMSEPLVRVLWMVDGDDRPLMWYLYDAIHHAKEEMLRRFQKIKARVKPFIDIINNRWDEQLYRNLYASTFWLNPQFQYDANIMDKHMSTISGLLDVLEKYAHRNLPLQSKITSEMKLFRNVEHDFGRASAINNHTLIPLGI